MQKATDDVRTAVERTRVQLPSGIDPTTVHRIDVDNAPILIYAVIAHNMSGTDRSWFIDKTVTRALQGQKGVAQVLRIGGSDREINVILDPVRIAALGVTAPQVNAALTAFSSDDPGGRASIGMVAKNIRVLGSSTSVHSVRNRTLPLCASSVRLSELAELR